MRDRQTADREVDHDPRVGVLGEGVPVHRRLRPDRDLGPDARVEGRRVVPRLGLLVEQLPVPAEHVERLEHRRHAEVVVVLADRAGARLLEVAEAGGHRTVVDRAGHALGVEVVAPVAGGIRARVGARRHHAQRIGRPGVGVAHLRLGPPPGRREPPRRREVGRLGADEGVDVLNHGRDSMTTRYGGRVPAGLRACDGSRSMPCGREGRPRGVGRPTRPQRPAASRLPETSPAGSKMRQRISRSPRPFQLSSVG